MSNPIQLDVTHIDLAHVEDDTGAAFVICRLIESSGLVLDVPIARHQAEAFGNSLAEYASEPSWP